MMKPSPASRSLKICEYSGRYCSEMMLINPSHQESRQQRLSHAAIQRHAPCAAPENVQQPEAARIPAARNVSAHPDAGAVVRLPLLSVPAAGHDGRAAAPAAGARVRDLSHRQ